MEQRPHTYEHVFRTFTALASRSDLLCEHEDLFVVQSQQVPVLTQKSVQGENCGSLVAVFEDVTGREMEEEISRFVGERWIWLHVEECLVRLPFCREQEVRLQAGAFFYWLNSRESNSNQMIVNGLDGGGRESG